FPLFAPWEYLQRIQPGDPHDPLLRQILPMDREQDHTPGYTRDPVGDRPAQLAPGLLQKYQSRVLLVTTGACAVHCRYCFRREYPYAETPRSLAAWQPALAQIAGDPAIDEVILSGGDPLTIADRQLAQLARQLDPIDHLRRLRIHTRLPIMIPSRINEPLLDWLDQTRLATIFVIHANHPAEIDSAVAEALARLIDRGHVVLNQAVLLAGVNDDADVLVDLSRKLVDLRVIPYYLHQLDRVAGTAHFEVPIARGLRLIQRMRRRLPGYAVPRYVRERAGAASKEILC
nr:EF-P beta-lysylation protein EpmB [Planctomycetales bacterium]NIM08734.1 EF-P beta-lysylation protein EpmB [Planctomycetales bacterium]NIN08204.1 EF-P beta-lysylation protein EpmB [Planctomycetales bacterium]NIN77332.1 EF-P beta-lysylation protein EpmB [Planctomycetales bacterium]NIO34516.1 EF-P beta-lysylation protein EpmB [Planctomycetales bacterium]